MARRKYIVKKQRHRWSSSINEFNQLPIVAEPGTFVTTVSLVSAPPDANYQTRNLYHIKNVELTADIHAQHLWIDGAIQQLAFYVMFVPQGMTITAEYNKQHPEYIMTYKYYGQSQKESQALSENTQSTAVLKVPLRAKTRLQRKLNTGDQIIVFIKGLNVTNDTITMYINGIVRYWTRAN